MRYLCHILFSFIYKIFGRLGEKIVPQYVTYIEDSELPSGCGTATGCWCTTSPVADDEDGTTTESATAV